MGLAFVPSPVAPSVWALHGNGHRRDVSGATVQEVTANYDAGPIIAQRQVPVLPGDTP